MEYMSAKEAAEKWALSPRRVQGLCSLGKIPGAKNLGKQWLIPSNAMRPVDGRSTKGKPQQKTDVYHFPLFVHSVTYVDREGLSEAEQGLLEAQLLSVQGKIVDSMAMCRKLLTNDLEPSLAIGTHFTIGINSFLLGLYAEYKNSIKFIERLLEEDLPNREDGVLLLSFLRASFDFDEKHIREIRPNLLSSSAYEAFLYFVYSMTVTTGKTYDGLFFAIAETECCRLQNKGIVPTEIALHMLIATQYIRHNRKQEAERHAERACELAIENEMILFYAKFSFYEMEAIAEETISRYGSNYAQELKRHIERNVKTWRLFHFAESNNEVAKRLNQKEQSALMLTMNGLTCEQIAQACGVGEDEVNETLNQLMERCGVQTIEELARYAEQVICGEQ